LISSEGNIHQLTDHLFRHQAGKMVAVLTRIFGLQNIELAEDVVQDAFAKAIKEWTYKTPENPAGWLMTVAKNKAIDVVRRQRYQKEFAADVAPLLKSEYTVQPVIDKLFMETEIQDSQLRMIFACCHPALSETEQVALTLKICSGFSVDEIARALLSNSEAIKKRLQRAKQFIAEEKLQLDIPVGDELKKRSDSVLSVLYLLFNEGYNSSSKENLIRKELCEEAIRLSLLITENKFTNQPKSFSLVALMTLLVSRFDARLDEQGEIVLLQDQDRSKWNQELINIGLHYLNQSAEGDELSEYHIEAAIVAQHSMAKNFSETNWPQILAMYDMLAQLNPSPVVLLNRAIVIGKMDGPAKAISAINTIPGIDKLSEKHYLFAATVGELHSQLHNHHEARRHFEKAIALTNSPVEKKLLKKKLNVMLEIGKQ
jgi:RNA polymerase sigma-70 factor (ECF subfamily)